MKERRQRYYGQWKELHCQFNYSHAKTTPYSVTTNNIFFFDTVADLNRFCEFKRRMQVRVMRFLSRKRLLLFKESFQRWKGSIVDFSEENIVSSHINEVAVDLDSASADKFSLEPTLFLERFTAATTVDYFKRMASSRSRVGVRGAEEDEYNDLTTLPLRLPDIIQKQEFAGSILLDTTSSRPASKSSQKSPTLPSLVNELPTYFPAESIAKLPPLLEIYDPKTAEGRITVRKDRRVGYCNYYVYHRGPTDSSFWIIPGRLACGPIPLGKGCTTEGRIPVPSVSALMLAGIDIFISLMEEEEELQYEKEFFAKLDRETQQLGQEIARVSVSEAMKTAFMRAGYSASEIILDNSLIIEKQNAKLAAIPEYGKTDPRREKVQREKLRYKARIKLANDRIDKAKAQLNRIPKQVDWRRMPTAATLTPDRSEMLLNIWDIEKLLKGGKNVYLYSRDGHGRVGMYGAILMGRLYGLHPYEVRFSLWTKRAMLSSLFSRSRPSIARKQRMIAHLPKKQGRW